MKKETLKALKKMSPEELQGFFHMRKRGYIQKNKKAYNRKRKHKEKNDD
jgi:hypothetical protein